MHSCCKIAVGTNRRRRPTWHTWEAVALMVITRRASFSVFKNCYADHAIYIIRIIHVDILNRGFEPKPGADHVPASRANFFHFCVHRSDFVHVTTRTSHDDGFIEIGAGFIVHGFSLFPARRFLIMDFRAGYSSTGEPQKITMYSPGRRRQFYNFIVSNGTFLILVKLSITFYESWYLVPSYEKRDNRNVTPARSKNG